MYIGIYYIEMALIITNSDILISLFIENIHSWFERIFNFEADKCWILSNNMQNNFIFQTFFPTSVIFRKTTDLFFIKWEFFRAVAM